MEKALQKRKRSIEFIKQKLLQKSLPRVQVSIILLLTALAGFLTSYSPEEFASYEEAAEFWDAHDTTHYPDSFETVEVQAELKHRRFEVEVDADLMPVLSKQAQSRGVKVSHLVSELLREKVRPAA